MKNYTLRELAKTSSTMNQLRNMIYHLIRYMQESGKNDTSIKKTLRKIGRNIAKTESKLFEFDGNSTEEVLKQIYDKILGSKISVANNYTSDDFKIEDKKCCTCKYHRKDISVAPCELINSMVSEMLIIYGFKVEKSDVEESMALGDLSCIHNYKIQSAE